MKIWKKDFTKNLKENKKQKVEEFTDINEASTPREENKKDKMEEIYSTKDKQIKYKRLTPLEAEEAAKRRQAAKEQLVSGEAEITHTTTVTEDKIVELTYEPEEGTVIADDIVEDFEQLNPKRKIELQDINEIDIDIDPTSAVKKYERQANSTQRHDERQKQKTQSPYEQLFGKPKFYVGTEKIVAKIPTYQHDSKINCIHLKAGRFTEVVENEYDEYLKSNDSIISKRRIHSTHDGKHKVIQPPSLINKAHHKDSDKTKSTQDTTTNNIKKKSPLKKLKKFFRIIYRMVIPKKDDKQSEKTTTAKSTDKPKTIAYQNRQDLSFLSKEITSNLRTLTVKAVLLLLLFSLALTLTFMEQKLGTAMFNGAPYTPLIYCAGNLVILLLIFAINKSIIINGIKPLRRFRGNSDTALAFAFFSCALQQIISIFMPGAFVESDLHLYTPIVTLGFLLNTMGRIFMVWRIKKNFSFINSKSPAYSAKIFNDEETARKMLSGTTASKSVIAYQCETGFLSDYLKISYAPDPSEEISGKLAPITIVSSVFVAIVYGIIFKTFIGGLSALAVMSCISIPVAALLAGNIPFFLLCWDSLRHNAMLSGFPSIKQFCDSDAVMVNATDLYPENSVKIKTIKYFAEYRVDEAMLSAAVILKEANSPLYSAFSDTLKKSSVIPKVESVIYEDKLGLVGWVNGERVLIGNRKLLDRFHIYIEDAADETKYKNNKNDVTYIACSGQLVAMVVTKYIPDQKVKHELHKAQKNGLCLVVSTTDSNITTEKIADDYAVYARTIKVLNTGFSNTCTDVCSKKEDTSRAYLATRGSFTSLIHAITNAVSFRHNLTIGLIIEIFGLILGVLLSATMVLYATVSILGIVEILLYMLFWGIATIVVQLVKLP